MDARKCIRKVKSEARNDRVTISGVWRSLVRVASPKGDFYDLPGIESAAQPAAVGSEYGQ